MSGVSRYRNSGVYMKGLQIHDAEVITAAAGNDNVEVDGNFVSRVGSNQGLFLSGKLIISFKAVLDEDETLSIAANLQDAVDSAGAAAADYGNAFALAVVATGGAGGTTERGVVEIDVDLSAAREFIQDQITADLSRGATDTVAISAVFVASGDNKEPIA